MTIVLLVWKWILGHSAKQLMWAGAVLAAGILAVWGIHHERAIGAEQLQAKQDEANALSQKIADKGAAEANAAIHAKLDPLSQAITDYGATYADHTRTADCSPVAYVPARVRSTGKAKHSN